MPLGALAPILPFLGAGAAATGSTLGTVLGVGSALAGLAGTGLEIAGQAESQAAENKVRANENAQQTALQNKASQVTATNIQNSSPANVNAELGAGASNRANAWEGLNQLTAPVASALPATGGSSDNSPTANAQKTAGSAADTWNNLVSGDAARLGSYSDLAEEQAQQDQNTAEQLGEINNFSRGDAALLPLELQVASQRGGQLSGWGSIASSLGNLAAMANQAGKFAPNAPQFQNGISDAQNQEMLNEMNGIGSPGMTGSGGYTPPNGAPGSVTLPASNTPNFWSTIYT